MAQAMLDKEALLEKLFIESCKPEMTKLVDALRMSTCSGCRDLEPNQLSHACVVQDHTCHPFGFTGLLEKKELVMKAMAFMGGRSAEVFETMKSIIESEAEFKALSLLDFVEFMALPSYPFARLTWDKQWQHRMLRLILGLSYEEDYRVSEEDWLNSDEDA